MEIILNALSYPFFFILFITIIVFVHELGHYLAARISGVKVDEFSIGFGKEIFGFYDSRQTRWKVCMIPLGGYVKMYGDADAASSVDISLVKKLTKAQKKISFYFQNRLTKAFIVVAGPLANYILAFIILAVMYVGFGKSHTLPVITAMAEDSAASQYGLIVGDKILSMDKQPVDSLEDVRRLMAISVGEPINIIVERQGQELSFLVVPKLEKTRDMFGSEITTALLGIASNKIEFKQMSVFESSKRAVFDCYEISVMTLKAMWQIATGARGLSENIGGPLKIAEYSAKSASQGFWSFAYLIAFFSLSIGLVNLLPIPMLDGGHLLIYLVESIIRQPINAKLLQVLFRIGFIFLIGLMVYATFNDVWRIIH